MKTPERITFDDEFLYIRGKKIPLTPKIRKEFAAVLDGSNQRMKNLLLHGIMATDSELTKGIK